MLAAIVTVTSPKWLVLKVIPKKTTKWGTKKAKEPVYQPSKSVFIKFFIHIFLKIWIYDNIDMQSTPITCILYIQEKNHISLILSSLNIMTNEGSGT